jgi:hypothetical protein
MPSQTKHEAVRGDLGGTGISGLAHDICESVQTASLRGQHSPESWHLPRGERSGADTPSPSLLIPVVQAGTGMVLYEAAGAAYQEAPWPRCALYASYDKASLNVFPIRYEGSPNEVWTVDPGVFPDLERTATRRRSRCRTPRTPRPLP